MGISINVKIDVYKAKFNLEKARCNVQRQRWYIDMCVSKYSIKNCCMLSFLFCDQLLMTIWVQNMGLQWYDS